MIKRSKQFGFTLIEILLILVIGSIIIFIGSGYNTQRGQTFKLNKTAVQMQQILNAGLAYYVKNGSWPASVTTLTANGYLPNMGTGFLSPYGTAYSVTTLSNNAYFQVTLTLPSTMTTAEIAGNSNALVEELPFGAIGGGNTVTAEVNKPGYNLNNATQMNFAGLYHHGACVPVPVCPVDPQGNTMTAEVFFVPISVSGLNDSGSSTNVYPISSFTAYASGVPGTSPPLCANSSTVTGGSDCATAAHPTSINDSPAASAYWRACVQILTEKGNVAVTRSDQWGQYVTLAAFTRCAVHAETSGSNFNMFSN